jgi:N-acetylmuramoyl-L-alanine amidase
MKLPSRVFLIFLVAFLMAVSLVLAAGCRKDDGENIVGSKKPQPKKQNESAPSRPDDGRVDLEREKTSSRSEDNQPPAEDPSLPGNATTPSVSSAKKFLVVVDPGHGNPGNPGPSGPSGLRESEVNLDIALRIRVLLESSGIRVIMTRTGPTTSLGNPERARLANENKADLFFRIHSDSSRDPTEGGTRTLWYKPDSEQAARIIQKAVAKELGLRDLGTRKQVLVGFQHAKVPAVLVEVAYLSNPAEEKLLADPVFRQRAAQGMLNGIKEYLE